MDLLQHDFVYLELLELLERVDLELADLVDLVDVIVHIVVGHENMDYYLLHERCIVVHPEQFEIAQDDTKVLETIDAVR